MSDRIDLSAFPIPDNSDLQPDPDSIEEAAEQLDGKVEDDKPELAPIPDERSGETGELLDAEEESEEEAKPQAEPPTEEAPAAEHPEGTRPEATPDYKEKAELYEAWADRWARDPAGFMQAMYGALDASQQKQFAAMTGAGAPVEAEPAYDAFQPQSPVEEWLVTQKQTIEQLPQFAKEVGDQFTRRDTYLNDALIRVAILEAKLQASLDLHEAAFPDVDRKAVEKALGEGKSYSDAVSAYADSLKTAVSVTKQKRAPRPNTPANGSGSAPTLDKEQSRDMVRIWKALSGQA